MAESCTGGLLAHRLTNVPGASAVFLAGYVTYANDAKASMLGVDPQLIEEHGAVSEPVARAMAEGARPVLGQRMRLRRPELQGRVGVRRKNLSAQFSLRWPRRTMPTMAKKFFFPTDRETFKQMATQAALDLLRRSWFCSAALCPASEASLIGVATSEIRPL